MRFRFVMVIATIALWHEMASAEITVTVENNPDILGQSLLGPGVNGLNFTRSGADGQFGFFSGAQSVLGPAFPNSGIVISTGNVLSAPGPNSADNISTAYGGGGDSTLDAMLPFGRTYDAASLSFDFETTGGSLFFNYFFASDEYNEYAGSAFNDIFAFIVNEENIANIPGSDTYVAINTVNAGTNAHHYNNNDPSDGGGQIDIEYDGYTNTFTASVENLPPGRHSISLKIADTSDRFFDSAVFLQAASFAATPQAIKIAPAVPEPTTWGMILTGFALAATAARHRRRRLQTPDLTLNRGPLTGETEVLAG